MARLTIRVLVADDYEPLRRFVSSTLKKLPQLQLVGEIRLPELNGFEVARQIREHIPQRICFEPLKPLAGGINWQYTASGIRLRRTEIET